MVYQAGDKLRYENPKDKGIAFNQGGIYEVVEVTTDRQNVLLRSEEGEVVVVSIKFAGEFFGYIGQPQVPTRKIYIHQKEVEVRTINNVVATKDYSVFKKMKGNREVVVNRKLEESIAEKGIIEPIVVNEAFEVINGQHRLAVAKKLGIEVPYIVRGGYSQAEMLELNTTSKRWTLVDYINKYAENGKGSYIELKRLIDEYPVTPTVLASIALGLNGGSGNMSEIVKKGKFTFQNFDSLVSFLEFYKQVVSEKNIKNITNMAYVLYQLYRIKKFEPARILKVQGAIAEKTKGVTQRDVLTKLILNCYNSRLSEKKQINYFETSEGLKIVGE